MTDAFTVCQAENRTSAALLLLHMQLINKCSVKYYTGNMVELEVYIYLGFAASISDQENLCYVKKLDIQFNVSIYQVHFPHL